MSVFVQENQSENDFPIKDKTGFCPDPGKNIVFYRRNGAKQEPVFLIDTKIGNVDFRDAEGQTFVAIDAENRKFLIGGKDPIAMIVMESRNREKSLNDTTRNIEITITEKENKLETAVSLLKAELNEKIKNSVQSCISEIKELTTPLRDAQTYSTLRSLPDTVSEIKRNLRYIEAKITEIERVLIRH